MKKNEISITPKISFMLKMDEDIHKVLKMEAAAKGITMQQLINNLLEKHTEKKK